MNYLSLKKFVLRTPVAPMDQTCKNRIMKLIPPHLLEGPRLQEILAGLMEEINDLFTKSIQMSNIQHILIKPEVKGLEKEKAGPPPNEPLGLNFKRAWHDQYQERRAKLKQNLHILQPTHGAILELCQTKLLNNKLLDIKGYRDYGDLTFEVFEANIDQDFTNIERKLMERWYPAAIAIFKKDKKTSYFDTPERRAAYLTSSSNLLTTMVKRLLLGCLNRYLNSFEPENHLLLPHLGMNLTLRDGEMTFSRGVKDLEKTVLYFVHRLCDTMQKIPTLQYALYGGELTFMDTSLAPHIVDDACEQLRKSVQYYFRDAINVLNMYKREYSNIIDGRLYDQLQEYLKEEHTFAQHKEYLQDFSYLEGEIQSLSSCEHLDLVTVNCEDLKWRLVEKSRSLCHLLLVAVIEEHKEESVLRDTVSSTNPQTPGIVLSHFVCHLTSR
ncbi:dynein heavy chain 12, axonemal-like [Plakobranchus ocellatus]|uniref:Dynein heavy chain 12, axonemal-like n=1 Tax=Plakobranchus ocellatus TaxID=259542 RepID=A0AAV4B7T9_9GAST|nr:dynein heavy chain 12, axonemal-like [Plakobranchus ocellatus]